MKDEDEDEIKVMANEIRVAMCKKAIDDLIGELEKIPDPVLLESVRPHIKIKIKLI